MGKVPKAGWIALAVVAVLFVFFSQFNSGPPIISDPVLPAPTVTKLPAVKLDDSGTFHTPDDYVQRIRGAKPGSIVARFSIPRLGIHDYPIRFGIGLSVLALGPGLYPGSAEPGEGNFSMAGHRITPVGPWDHGPFRYVDTLERGDFARVHYKGDVYVYAFQRTLIIDPDNTSILKDKKADMTFTACHPPGYATQRIVAQWKLVRVKKNA